MNAAVIVAGGSGDRFGREGGKQFAPVAGAPLVAHTLQAFQSSRSVAAVVVVCHADRLEQCRATVEAARATKVVAVVAGGETRRMSVAAGLAALPPECEVVAVHDGARALIEAATIDEAVGELLARPGVDGVVVGHPAFDTMKDVEPTGKVASTWDRSRLWVAQTPQVFRTAPLARAHERAAADGFEGTDDASLVERDGGTVVMLRGPRWNFKVTVPEDLEVLEVLLRHRHATGEPS